MIATKLKLLTLGLAATTGVVATQAPPAAAPAAGPVVAPDMPADARPAVTTESKTDKVEADGPPRPASTPVTDLAILARLERPFVVPDSRGVETLGEYIEALHLDAPDPEHGLPRGIPMAWEARAEKFAKDDNFPIDVDWPAPPTTLRGALTRAASQILVEYRVEGGRLVFEFVGKVLPRPFDGAPAQKPAVSDPTPSPELARDARRRRAAPSVEPAPAVAGGFTPAPRRPADVRPGRPSQDDGAPTVPGSGRSPYNAELAEPAPTPKNPITLLDPQPSPREVEDAKRNEAIMARLDQPIPLHFATKASLNTLVEFLKQSTAKAGEKPIPIFVDQRIFGEDVPGQQIDHVAKDGNEPLIVVDLEDVPLRTSLRLALRQVGLDYVVADGILIIGRASGLEDLAAPPGKMIGPMGGMGGMM